MPVVAEDLDGAVDRDGVIKALRDIFSRRIDFVGHNLKYDFVLLRRHGCKISSIYFDTMLATHECFGDWDLLNLSFVAKKLLNKEITSYKDIVRNDQTFLDVPFREILVHACEDADVTLQLYHVLQNELAGRGLVEQHRGETLKLATTLGKWEVEGVPVDSNKLSRLRKQILDELDAARKAAIEGAGIAFDPCAEEELDRLLRRDPKIAELMGFRRATLRVLEELGICHSLPRSIVNFLRVQKQLRQVEEIQLATENGKVYPVFSQVSNDHGQLTAIRPKLFEDFGHHLLSGCFKNPLKGYFRSASRSLDIIEKVSGDTVLKRDRRAAGASGRFLTTGTPLSDVDHGDLLLSAMMGVSSACLSRRFLHSRSAIASIFHDLEVRYCRSFKWLEEYRQETMRLGFALNGDKRRWFDGLRSSDLAKRQRALDSAVRWLLRY